MLSACGYAPAFVPISKTMGHGTQPAQYDFERRAISRVERADTIVGLIEVSLRKKASRRYSHAPWLIVDADFNAFNHDDVDGLKARLAGVASILTFQRAYCVDTFLSVCWRIE
jgi:hypothetical protein